MSRFARVLAALFMVLLPAVAHAGSLVFDPFTTPFYAAPCVEHTGRWVMFPNRFCPGTCPPDSFLLGEACPSAIVISPDLRLPLAPDGRVWRCFQLAGIADPDDDSYVEMLPAEGAFEVHDHSPGRWWFLATWQSPAWDLDLAALGVTALRLSLTGEIDEARPLFVTAIFESDDGTYRQERLEARVGTTGDLVLPFAGAAPSHVVGVVLVFTGCPADGDLFCDSPPMFGPRRYRIGAPSFDTNVTTPALRQTWGALKTLAR